MEITQIKGEIVIIKIDGQIKEVKFSHYKSKHSVYFYDTEGKKYHINQLI
jgi:hypothetical protein